MVIIVLLLNIRREEIYYIYRIINVYFLYKNLICFEIIYMKF